MRADALRKRRSLLIAGAAAFDREGVDVKLEDVAREAGVAPATLYRHFPTREALIVGVYLDEVELLCNGIEELLAAMPADVAMWTWMDRFVRYVANKRGMASAIKTITMSTRTEEIDQYRQRLRDATQRLIDVAEQARLIRPDITADDLIAAMGGICLVTDRPELAEQASRLVQLLIDSLRYGSPADAPRRPAETARP